MANFGTLQSRHMWKANIISLMEKKCPRDIHRRPCSNLTSIQVSWVRALAQPHMSRITTNPTKWHVRQAKTQISLGICPVFRVRVFAVRMKKAWVLNYPLSAQRRLWSDWADLSLRWAHRSFCGFVMRRIISFLVMKKLLWPFSP